MTGRHRRPAGRHHHSAPTTGTGTHRRLAQEYVVDLLGPAAAEPSSDVDTPPDGVALAAATAITGA